MSKPKWYVKGNWLFEIKEVVETKKTFLLTLKGHLGSVLVRKKDKGLYMKKPRRW